jgi:hypothetical protein
MVGFLRSNKEILFLGLITAAMLAYFIIARPVMMDDGFHYEGFAETLAHGRLDFKDFYGFQGLSILSVSVFWLTGSHDSIIITSAVLSLLSIWLAYAVGRDYHGNKKSGLYFALLFLLIPYPYATMMRGFQEAALLFFILLIIYGSINKKLWTPIAWAFGGIVKPFTLVLLPLFIRNFFKNKKLLWLIAGLALGALYLGLNYYETGHFINNAAINSYKVGEFKTGSPPELARSFTFGIKGFLRIGANLLIYTRKILFSPLALIIGAVYFLKNKDLKLRKEILLAIVLNVLLVASLTFSFQKYLLPLVALLALMAVPYLVKYRWLMALVIIDSFFVFLSIYDYFGRSFWPNVFVFLSPLYLVFAVFIFSYPRPGKPQTLPVEFHKWIQNSQN